MTRNIIFIPIGENTDTKTAILSYSKILEKNKISFSVFTPIVEKSKKKYVKNLSDYIKKIYRTCKVINSVYIDDFTILLKKKIYILYLEKILDYYSVNNQEDVVLIEGISYKNDVSMNFFNQLNLDISHILNAEIIFILNFNKNFIQDFLYKSYIIHNFFLKKNNSRCLGIIINLLDNVALEESLCTKKLYLKNVQDKFVSKNSCIECQHIPILGIVSLNKKKFSIERRKLLDQLNVKKKYIKNISDCVINLIILYKRGSENIKNFLNENVLLIVQDSDFFSLYKFYDIFRQNNIFFSILVITNNSFQICNSELYLKLKNLGISIFMTYLENFEIFYYLNQIHYCYNNKFSKKDSTKFIFSTISDKLLNILEDNENINIEISSYKFLYHLKKISQNIKRTIIFPEGENSNIIQAVNLCYKLNICNCVLIGNSNLIYKKSQKLNINLPESIKIYDPKLLISQYINIFSKIYKILDVKECEKILKKNNIIISMILLNKFLQYHGLVAGIENTTADVIRPALKVIGMKKNIKLISSIFFMLFEEKVFVYGDCAINPNPSALDLSEIAIQSADSAKLFGITPKIAMLSYSTNDSGSGIMVDKVRLATDLVRQKRPDLIVEGPIQYDSATSASVAEIKCPNSKIFGKANVFVFPDLNSGNITYKAVQRSCSIISIGPMIQGLNKPINDLSRGASIEDILYTIAVTVIQSYEK
ncbi:Phosphate acetyltransferase [Buchnera aphidicola (Sipha maydis)]|uniref:phosphate acetyltransferase n=1 Tax=Buchnera aphidicola TaxID=9 RepID=UPI0034640DAC